MKYLLRSYKKKSSEIIFNETEMIATACLFCYLFKYLHCDNSLECDKILHIVFSVGAQASKSIYSELALNLVFLKLSFKNW
jgi:hypothetical protein